MALLSRKQFMAIKLPTADVDVPQLGGTVRLQAFSVLRRVDVVDAYLQNLQAVEAHKADLAKPEEERQGLEPVRQYDDAALQLLMAVVDEDGEPVFTVDDYDWFTAIVAYGAINKLWNAFKELNAIGPTNVKVEEKKGPSDEVKNDSSSSD